VAAGNRDTAAAAAEVLRLGGSAVDAALAAGFAAAVAEPALTSLGGGGFLLDAPSDGAPTLVDFFVDVPGLGRAPSAPAPTMNPITVSFSGADQVFSAGWGSAAVPGCLAGYLRVHQHRGTVPLAQIVAPARRLAREGVRLDRAQADVLVLLADILTLTVEGRVVFAPRGRLLGAGEYLRNPDFADLLDQLADGTVIDLSAVAADLEAAMEAGGGAMTRGDLEHYTVHEREPLRLTHPGGELFSNPPPSFGASLVLRALAELGGSAPGRTPGLAESAESAESYERYARQLVAMTERHAVGPTTPGVRSVRGTTHVSVVDGAGNVAAMTTSNGSCSGVFVPGTGIQLNNMLGEADLHPAGAAAGVPGTRVGSMMMPTVVRRGDGTVVGVGSGGSERIPSALARVLTGVLEPGRSLSDVVGTPRLHWDRRILQVEPGLPAEVLDLLAASRPVHEWSRPDLYFGGVHAVARHPDGTVEAVGDARRGGAALVVDL
jgi:gamma-glutamyltranspeptidase/glutathione hydrolase